MSGQGPKKSVREMTGLEMERVRVDLFRKAKELGADHQEAEDLASEALLCFYRWADGGQGSQLSHAIAHARGKMYGYTGTGKNARVRSRPQMMADLPLVTDSPTADDHPDGVAYSIINRAAQSPEKALILGIDFKAALQRGDASLVAQFMAVEFSADEPADIARRYGIARRTLEQRVLLFRRYLAAAMAG